VGYYADFADADALPKTWMGGFYHDGTFSSFRGRDHGSPVPRESAAWRLVTFAQDHDQIGNRAAGDRLSATLSPERLAVAAVLTMSAPGTPMLFMGEEWGATTPWQFFTSHPERELAEATAAGRRAEFADMGWDEDLVPDPNDPATFERSKLDWAEVERHPHARLLELYRRLARLRRERPELTDPHLLQLSAETLDPDAAPSQRRFVLRRGSARVLVNLSTDAWEAPVEAGETVWIATVDAAASGASLTLPPDSAAIVGPGVHEGAGSRAGVSTT
jgi:maltooligosyltrehalose trehalohydrolase